MQCICLIFSVLVFEWLQYSILLYFVLFYCLMICVCIYSMYILYLSYFLLRLLIGLCKDVRSLFHYELMLLCFKFGTKIFCYRNVLSWVGVPILVPTMCHRDIGLPWGWGGSTVILGIFHGKVGLYQQVLLNVSFQYEHCQKKSKFFRIQIQKMTLNKLFFKLYLYFNL